jgi:phospholipid-binding lipoprotein MlaA
LIVFSVLSACATTANEPAVSDSSDSSTSDPWEPANRAVYAFNDGLDKVSLKPVAKGYRKVFPAFMRRGVNNFFSNLRTPVTIINQVLQGKGRRALSDTGRLLVNSTIGIGGLFDPATAAGIGEHDEDFGQTLATWGIPDGPYVMLPLLGPRNLRDAVALPLDLLAYPLYQHEETAVRDKLLGLDAVNTRARLLAAEGLIEDSTDAYVTIREAYRQNREFKIFDGEPPDDYDEFFDDYEE